MPDGHLLVLEVKNIGDITCRLAEAELKLLPNENGGTGDSTIRNGYPSLQLEPGEWAHVLIAWLSQHYLGQQCQQHWGIQVRLIDPPERDPVDVDLRNVVVQSCSNVYDSGYRKGPYTRDSRLPDEMVKSSEPPKAGWYSIPRQIPWQEVRSDSPLYQVSTIWPRMMLGADPQLDVLSPVDADNGCTFRVMRMREPSGRTVFWFQECPFRSIKEIPARIDGPGVQPSGVFPSINNMSPQQTGWVDFDFVANLGNTTAPQWARSHLRLRVRDPKPPDQAAILDPLPACKLSQLNLAALDPVISDPKRFVRAYQATNTSAEACSVAGVPKVDVADPRFSCPNCVNDLFGIRPNGRIDLPPGESAHFLLGTKSIDRDFDFKNCTGIATMHLNLFEGDDSAADRDKVDRDKELIELPYGGCILPYEVSAWRAGKYDGDASNLNWAKTHAAVAEPLGQGLPDCDKPELQVYGHPATMQSGTGITYGLSMTKHEYVEGEPVSLHLWVDNTSDRKIGVMTCAGLEYFKDRGFDVYDAYGHRLLGTFEKSALDKFPGLSREEACRTDKGRFFLDGQMWACTRNFPIYIPAHTCVTRDDGDFTAGVSGRFDLPPGEYTIRPRNNPDGGNLCSDKLQKLWNGAETEHITFSVSQP
jgi:hypothetical protein